jgi:hypothetical protein
MKIEDILGRGYFPAELPPPFTTSDLANKYAFLKGSLSGAIDKNSTRCVNYSISKIGLIRKHLKIPNPMHHIKLCEEIVNNWTDIETIYGTSSFSFTRPKLTGLRAANPGQFKDFVRRSFLASYPYTFELKTDIAKYYPSIYTHSIPWAIHGKKEAKAARYDKTLLGNKLDASVQQTMYGQTIGLPIGPDTSLIISEIIGCSIDLQLAKAIPNLKGYRYIDDMSFFFHSYAEAESCLIELQKALKEFELQINAEKTSIRKIPIGIEPEWVLRMRSFSFRDTEAKQYNDIISFFSAAFDLSNQLPNQFVLAYAVSRIKRVIPISYKNWALIETMLLKTMIAEPSTIKEVFRILYTHSTKVSVKKIEKVLMGFISYHCKRGDDYEVSWALWIAKTFKIKIICHLSKELSRSKDTISILIILDLIESGLIDKADISTEEWDKKLEKESLYDENWLLAYEISIKKWIGTSYSYIDEVSYFNLLRKSKVSFYNPDLQIEPLDLEQNDTLIEKPQNKTSNIEPIQESEINTTADLSEDANYDLAEASEDIELFDYGFGEGDFDYLDYF